jgi:hypothetical protein
MKRSLLSLLMVAFLILGVSACAEKRATYVDPASGAPKTDIAVQTGGAPKPADAPNTKANAAEPRIVQPADALKVILLQLLVAR